MKNQQYLLFIGLLGISFLFSDYATAPKQHFSFQKVKKDGVIKPENNNLKTELLNLENTFKSEHDNIKNDYQTRIQSLKQTYKERRRAIYQKYGVKPPKRNNKNDMMDSNVFKPETKKKGKRLPIIKSKK